MGCGASAVRYIPDSLGMVDAQSGLHAPTHACLAKPFISSASEKHIVEDHAASTSGEEKDKNGETPSSDWDQAHGSPNLSVIESITDGETSIEDVQHEPLHDHPTPEFPDIEISPMSRTLLLTWARWGRNSKRVHDERHFKQQYRRFQSRLLEARRQSRAALEPTPPDTPRGNPATTPLAARSRAPVAVSPNALASALKKQANSKEKKAKTPDKQKRFEWTEHTDSGMEEKTRVPEKKKLFQRARSRSLGTTTTSPLMGENDERRRTRSLVSQVVADDDGLFAELRGAQVRAMESQGMKHKLTRALPEDVGRANTVDRRTPGFGLDTPNFPCDKSTAQSSHAPSGQESSSVLSVAMSPWLLAESDSVLEFLPSIDEFSEAAFNLWSMQPSDAALSYDVDGPAIFDRDELETARLPAASRGDLEVLVIRPKMVNSDPEKPSAQSVAGVYPDGSAVLYFSKSRIRWMPGFVVQMVGDLYLVDKGFGCRGRCAWSDLMNDVDEKQSIYRIIDVLDGAGAPVLKKVTGARVIRDDFSSDEDE